MKWKAAVVSSFTALFFVSLFCGTGASEPLRNVIAYTKEVKRSDRMFTKYKVSLFGQPSLVKFSLWDDNETGTMVWSEPKAIVILPFIDTQISTLLGDTVPFADAGVDFSQQLWVQVEIKGKKFGARDMLAGAPYALWCSDSGSTGVAGPTGPTGPTGDTGADGQSAYELFLAGWDNGTAPPPSESEWLASLTGATGATGPAGADGAAGPAGAAGPTGPTGADGQSAYELYVDNDTSGSPLSQPDWLASLTGATGATGPAGATGAVGPTGAPGAAGDNGTDGADGATGPTGPTGAQGDPGDNGTDGAVGPTGPTGATGATGSVENSAAAVAAEASTDNATYDDITGSAGPAVTVTTDTSALVIVTALVSPNGADTDIGYMSFAVSGATTLGADDTRALIIARNPQSCSATFLVTGLTAGSNTFTAKYKTAGGNTVSFANRSIVVVPQ